MSVSTTFLSFTLSLSLSQSQGVSALYLAAQGENPFLCYLLLEAGADVSVTTGPQNLTPLHIAAHR